MNSKKQIVRIAVIVFAAAMLFSGCKKDIPEGLAVEYIPKKIPAAGGTASFTIHPGSAGKWAVSFLDSKGTVQASLDWIKLSQSSGEGETDVTVTILPNDTGERIVDIVITAGKRNIPVRITQRDGSVDAPLYFEVTPESYRNLPPSEGGNHITRSLAVESNRSWYAGIVIPDSATHGNWVTFLPDQVLTCANAASPAFGDSTLNLSIDNYGTIDALPREAKVRFYDTDGTLLQEVPVSQNAIPVIFEVTPGSYLNLPHDGNMQYHERQLKVTANISWYAEIVVLDSVPGGDGNWINFIPGSVKTCGSAASPVYGDSTLNLAIAYFIDRMYIGEPPRKARVRFYNTSGTLLKEVPISQNATPLIFEVDPESYLNLPSMDATGGNVARSLTVTANIPWYAEIAEIHGDPDLDQWCLFLPAYSMTHGSEASPAYGNTVLDLFIGIYYNDVPGLPVRETKIRFYHSKPSGGSVLLKEVPISQNPDE